MSDHSAKEAKKTSGERKTTVGLEALGLTAVGLSSAVVPEAAFLAIKLKWFILLGSFLPLCLSHFYKKKGYMAVYRAAAIWLCNSFVLLIAYFFNNQYPL